MGRLGAGRADAVDLHDMGQLGIALGAGGGFEPRGVAAGQSDVSLNDINIIGI
jgi:hypothetical protein